MIWPINIVSNAGKSDIKIACVSGSILDDSSAESPNIYSRGLYLLAPMQELLDLMLMIWMYTQTIIHQVAN